MGQAPNDERRTLQDKTMSIRFAAPAGRLPGRIDAATARRARFAPANDNGPALPAPDFADGALDAALRLFSRHGLAAATHARARAEDAFFAGDRPGYRRWLGICRALDRRMARELSRVTDGRD